MELNKLKQEWDKFGILNPQWAVLNKEGEKMNLSQFFKTGEKEIRNIINYLSKNQIKLNKGKALDFGCGMGRLTQALTPYFKKVYGVDISPSMIELSKKNNKYPKKCEFILNETDNLTIFEKNSFDFIYTVLVLQHMEPKFFLKYIKEFLHILKPNGILIFQLPSKRKLSWQTVIEIIFPKKFIHFMKKKVYGAIMEMHTYDKDKMIEFLNKNKGDVFEVLKDNSAGKRFISFKYYVKKV